MMWLLKYWRVIIAMMLIAIVLLWADSYSRSQYKAGYNAATAKISAELAKSAEKQAEQAREASTKYQTTKAAREQKERIRYVEVQKIIKQPIYRNHCFDDNGLQQLNAAIADSH